MLSQVPKSWWLYGLTTQKKKHRQQEEQQHQIAIPHQLMHITHHLPPLLTHCQMMLVHTNIIHPVHTHKLLL